MPREIEVNWVTNSGSGKVSVFNFNDTAAVADQREDLDTFLTGISGALDTSVSWTIATAGREWNDATGALEGAWTDGTVRDGAGTVSGEPVADATQILFRWQTSDIANGRFVVGRTFVPGCAAVNLEDGNLEESLAAAIEANGQTLADSLNGFVVWHRPSSGSGGSVHAVGTCDVWREFAVLRRRRG